MRLVVTPLPHGTVKEHYHHSVDLAFSSSVLASVWKIEWMVERLIKALAGRD